MGLLERASRYVVEVVDESVLSTRFSAGLRFDVKGNRIRRPWKAWVRCWFKELTEGARPLNACWQGLTSGRVPADGEATRGVWLSVLEGMREGFMLA